MKKIFILFCFLAIVIQSTFQLWIQISFEINRSFIEKNLCENRLNSKKACCRGKCYLNKKLQANEKRNEHLLDLKQKEFQISQDRFASLLNLLYKDKLNASYPTLIKERNTGQELIVSIFHPPWFC